MNILYLSCHSILEYDECKLLSQLGYKVRSIGSYTNPHSPGDPKRPPIPSMEVNLQHIDISNRFHQDTLHEEHLEWADKVIFMHMPNWIQGQLEKLQTWGKPVIFRSIGQSSPEVELQLQNIKVVLKDQLQIIKYSKRELLWPHNAGCDRIIPFYKDIEYTWNVDETFFDVVFCMQSAKQRGNWTKFDDVFDLTTAAGVSNRILLGPGNEELADTVAVQCPDYENLLWNMSKSKLFVYSGTIPASYTLAPLEAIMIGTPTVTITDDWWRKGHESWVPTGMFDVPAWIPDELLIDKVEGVELIQRLLAHPDWLEMISHDNREYAMKHFSKALVSQQWKDFLG